MIPCATCWDENCQASLGRVRRETHDYDTSAKWMPCPDCGVETPEAAGRIAEIRERFDKATNFGAWEGEGDDQRITEAYASLLSHAREDIEFLLERIAQGWTPPGTADAK